ncbi:MAG: redoxin domain-containing protein [Elusimicrobiota bacterium]
MKKLGLAAALTASAVVVYFLASRNVPDSGGTGSSFSEPERNSPDPNEKAPALSGRTLDGKTLALSSLSGKVVLVDFWATWCDPCKEEIPDLVKLRDRLKDKGFEILGDSMDEDGEKAVKRFLVRQPIPYPIILNGGERPPAGWVVPGMPTAYLIGRHGEVLKRWFGEKDMPDLEKDVTAALAK